MLDFAGRLEAGDTALFFYAGHGVEIDGRNYLLPTDIPPAGPGQERFVQSEAIAVDEVVAAIAEGGARISILVLDACRDNPFARGGTRGVGATRGLARMAAPAGTFIMYSAGVGQSALDRLNDTDADPNSVFTRTLIPLLRTPGLSLTETARRVRQDVEKLAGGAAHLQRPAYYDEVTGDVFLAGRGDVAAPGPAPVAAAPAPPAPPSADARAAEAWAAVQDTASQAVLEAFIASFPGTVYATFAAARLDELRRQAARTPAPAAPQPQAAPTAPPPRMVSYHYLVGLDPKGDNFLALKAAPNLRSMRLAKMGPHTLLRVTGRQGVWLQVEVANTELAGRTGWAFAKYVACCREVAVAAPGPAAVPRDQLLAFVRDVYLPATGADGVPAWAFAPTVDYYDSGPTSRDRVLQDKTEYFRKWPQRTYAIQPETFRADPSGAGYDVSFEYRFAVAGSSARLSGRGVANLTLVPEGGSFQISREHGSVLERD
jgi:uncharacterized caspase-like protein